MIKITSLILTFFISYSCLFSQAVGEWKSYFPFKNIISIVKNGDKVYGATKNGIIVQDYKEGVQEYLTEVNALTDIGITSLGFNEANNALIVGYENGNLDLIIENQTTNLFQIKESTIVGDKTVYNIFCKDDLAYISCGFGIVVFDVSKKEIKDTYIIGTGGVFLKINCVFVHGGIIYAGTEDGLYSASETSLFLTDFNSWSKSTTLPNPSKSVDKVIQFDNKIVVNSINSIISDSLFIQNGSTWDRIPTLKAEKTNSITSFNKKLIVLQYDSILVLDENYLITETIDHYNSFWKPKANVILYDGSHYYIGDKENAMIKLTSNANAEFSLPKSIFSDNVLDLEVEGGQLWCSSGIVGGSQWNKHYNIDGIYNYDIKEDKWTIYNSANQYGSYCFAPGCMSDFIGVAVSSKNPKIGIACSYSLVGIAELSNGKVINHYDTTNSSMQISTIHGDRIGITDAQFDEDENLWVINSFVDNPLLVKNSAGVWESFYCGNSSQKRVISKLMIDEANQYKWMVVKDNNIVVYNDNQTPLNKTDDQYKFIDDGADKGNLSEIPTCIGEDIDGEIWIGTEQGIFVIYNPIEIFNDGEFEAQRIKVEFEGNVEFLLENEIITSITVDGGNRKWIGTSASGFYVLSPDGLTQIHHFTQENSPLLSNFVKDIAIDGETGVAYISTDKGLISFKGEATEADPTLLDVYAYPNPIPPSYNGKIAIKGMAYDSDVKITDLTGNTVFVTKSLGGQAIWDGNKLDGTRASSGIYLVFMTDPDGVSKKATKILFMK